MNGGVEGSRVWLGSFRNLLFFSLFHRAGHFSAFWVVSIDKTVEFLFKFSLGNLWDFNSRFEDLSLPGIDIFGANGYDLFG